MGCNHEHFHRGGEGKPSKWRTRRFSVEFSTTPMTEVCHIVFLPFASISRSGILCVLCICHLERAARKPPPGFLRVQVEEIALLIACIASVKSGSAISGKPSSSEGWLAAMTVWCSCSSVARDATRSCICFIVIYSPFWFRGTARKPPLSLGSRRLRLRVRPETSSRIA